MGVTKGSSMERVLHYMASRRLDRHRLCAGGGPLFAADETVFTFYEGKRPGVPVPEPAAVGPASSPAALLEHLHGPDSTILELLPSTTNGDMVTALEEVAREVAR